MTKCKCMNCDCNIIHDKHVAETKSQMMDDEILFDIADFYKALADSTRIKIINALDKNELCVCDLSALLNMTKSAVSHQLQNLREMRLVKCRRQGKEALYSLADDHVRQVFEISTQHVLEMKNENKG